MLRFLAPAALAAALVLLLTAACDEAEEELLNATLTPAATETPTPEPTSTPAATVNYTDPTYGYSFDYPATWYAFPEKRAAGSVTLYSYDPANTQGVGPVPRDKLKVFFWVAEGVDKPLEQWLEEGKNSPGQITPPTVLSQSGITIAGKQGLVETTEHDGVSSTSYYIPIGGNRVFVVNAGPADSQVWPQFETVLSSIRFAP